MTTTPSLTAQQHFAMIKHLAGGKTLDTVAVIFKTTPEHVRDVARHHGYPDVKKLAWAADILEKKLQENAAPVERPSATGTPVRPAAGRPITPTTIAPVRPDELRVLINTARSHPSKRIRSAADRLIDQVNRLKTLIADDAERNAEKRKAEAEKAAARAEVERLEQQLKDAKAKLRGTKVIKEHTETTPIEKKTSTAPKGEYPCRNDGCDKVIDTPQGRGLHERQHCEHRTQAAS